MVDFDPGTHDTEEIERLLQARGDAKGSKNYELADEIKAQLDTMDVVVDDRRRVYSCLTPEIGKLHRDRMAAKRAKDYETADALQEKMVAAGYSAFQY